VTRHLQTLAFVFAFALASTVLVSTQDKDRTPPPGAKPLPAGSKEAPAAIIPLKVQVVIGRYQGDKKISSMPYAMTMNAWERATLRMGVKIPVMMISGAPEAKTPDGKPIPTVGPIQYQDVGTNIDCLAKMLEDGRVALAISVDDTSVYFDEQSGSSKNNPSFRSFRATNSMVLKDGETGQFTAATDKVTGETVKVDVTLTVVK
jgi:Bacterial type II and III secretion system protein